MIQKLACSAALLATIASTAHAQRTAAANCAAVQKQHLTDVKITEAVAVAATATASVIFTSLRCCFCMAAQLAAAVRWACAVLAIVASRAAEQASRWIIVEATGRGWQRE